VNRIRWSVLAGWLCSAALGAQANPNPMDSIRKLPTYRPAYDTVTLLAPARIARYELYPGAWTTYLQHSREQYARDTAAMRAELRATRKTGMTRPPYTHDFSVKAFMTDAWFATDSARRLAEIILSFQAPNGGWSKHVDFTAHVRAPGESYYAESADWEWISTIDNDATTEELHFLRLADAAHHDERYVTAIRRGVDYLLASQYPNGCFPQIYPLEGSYHDAVTFNDNATVNVLRLLREVAGGAFRYPTQAQRDRAAKAVRFGDQCVLSAQVRVNKILTAWGQQHDPLTLAPTSARSYELTSLTALESAEIVDYLMTLPASSDQVVSAVYAAVDWLRAVQLHGLAYDHYTLTSSPNAPPLWGRLYEIGTNRVIMANRDGVKLYDWNKLTDRRSGYGWYTTKPSETLATFANWSRSHPRPK
jgi:PelA/Pel-15E family pectate lyase